MKGLLSLGDCNTLGILENEGNAYPERVSKHLGIVCTNRGLTMASSYELVDLFILRKIARKVVKKYKKVARSTGMHTRFGDKYVVDEKRYFDNLRLMIETVDTPFILIETTPTDEPTRNKHIKRYNYLMEMLSKEYAHTYFVRCFDLLSKDMETYIMDDGVHLTSEGHQRIADIVVALIEKEKLMERE